MGPDRVFDVYVLKEDKTPVPRSGAFHRDPMVPEVPYGLGKEPDRALFTRMDIVLTGQGASGDAFEIRLPGELVTIDSIDKGLGHWTFWLTDGQRLVGLRAARHEAREIEARLAAYGQGASGADGP